VKKSLLIIALLALTGCSTVMTGYEATAVDAIKRADDQRLGLQVIGICSTPYSAVLRNPQVIPGVEALCLHGANTAPAALFDGVRPK
jgi:uncharacterized protein YceK